MKLYYPYDICSESPIPYLFKKMAQLLPADWDISIFQSTKTNILCKPNVNKLYIGPPGRFINYYNYLKYSLNNYDIIHTGGRGSLHLIESKISKLYNQSLDHVHTLRIDVDPESTYNTKIRKRLVNNADVVTAVSQSTASSAERWFGIDPIVIYNGVDTDLFHPNYPEPSIFKNNPISKPVFIYVGSLIERKRPRDVIKVAESVKDATFIIIGNGDKYKELKAISRSLDNVILTGRISKEKLPSIYSNSTALLFPSVSEGCPNVVLEAMASGIPVIGYKATSMPELIGDNERGILVEKGNVDKLTQATRTIVTNSKSNNMSKRTRKYVADNHNFNYIINKYKVIYDKIYGA